MIRDGEKTRQRILDCVRQAPGIIKSDLARSLGLGWGTVSYHLKWMARAGFIVLQRPRKELRIFPAEMPRQKIQVLAILSEGTASKILHSLRENPGQNQSDICSSLGLARKVVRRQLEILDQGGLVERHDGPHRPKYQATRLVELEAAVPAHPEEKKLTGVRLGGPLQPGEPRDRGTAPLLK